MAGSPRRTRPSSTVATSSPGCSRTSTTAPAGSPRRPIRPAWRCAPRPRARRPPPTPTAGRPVSVSGFASSITYNPSGTLATVSRVNGVTFAQQPDPTGMPRPASLGVTAPAEIGATLNALAVKFPSLSMLWCRSSRERLAHPRLVHRSQRRRSRTSFYPIILVTFLARKATGSKPSGRTSVAHNN